MKRRSETVDMTAAHPAVYLHKQRHEEYTHTHTNEHTTKRLSEHKYAQDVHAEEKIETPPISMRNSNSSLPETPPRAGNFELVRRAIASVRSANARQAGRFSRGTQSLGPVRYGRARSTSLFMRVDVEGGVSSFF